jgi:hypothetical protein
MPTQNIKYADNINQMQLLRLHIILFTLTLPYFLCYLLITGNNLAIATTITKVQPKTSAIITAPNNKNRPKDRRGCTCFLTYAYR